MAAETPNLLRVGFDSSLACLKFHRLVGNGTPSIALRVAARYLQAREFSSPDALREYLHDHSGADKSKHYVRKDEGGKGKSEKPKDDGGGLELLKGRSKGERKRLLEQALEINDAEDKGRAPKKLKDLSKQPGFEALKDLSHAEQKKVVEKALKDL